ncbi:exported hypothetical protein [Pseudoclavibacter sp. 8L]|nr:exported hypothetical protein [Pseudoclavibacter sp. 8L]
MRARKAVLSSLAVRLVTAALLRSGAALAAGRRAVKYF